MADDAQQSRLQRLALAKKKLKEHQERHGAAKASGNTNNNNNGEPDASCGASTTASVASNLSERSESEQNLNGSVTGQTIITTPNEGPTAACLFAAPGVDFGDSFGLSAVHINQPERVAPAVDGELNAIQLLISEKAELTRELNKCKRFGRERELEVEELRTQYAGAQARAEQLQTLYEERQRDADSLRKSNAELQHQLTDKQTHVDELQQQLTRLQAQHVEQAQQLSAQAGELEMAQLRLRQLNDESNTNGNVSAEKRVETQTLYAYEQQIRDLQSMVQQLSKDKEQAQAHYQNYVAHLNGEMTKLNERNGELSAESARLQERERQLVEHVGSLEREIQRNISRQAEFSAQQEQQSQVEQSTNQDVSNAVAEAPATPAPELLLSQLKSQDEELQQLRLHVAEQQTRMEQLASQQPDAGKLLATMESDKLAASRAVTQNVQLKQQLDELEQRFVQLTNEKAELVNAVDATAFAGRQLHTERDELKTKHEALQARFKLKDEEMIRLSHENMELIRQNSLLLQQLGGQPKRNEVREEYRRSSAATIVAAAVAGGRGNEGKAVADEQNDGVDGAGEAELAVKAHEQHQLLLRQQHAHIFESKSTSFDDSEISSGVEGKEDDDYLHEEEQEDDAEDDDDGVGGGEQHNHRHHHDHSHGEHQRCIHLPVGQQLPTEFALEKLQTRFARLMGHVAELTEEKQRLEHLVTQLQGETETIGEYVTLYQTQRRMLKQREYEKAAQMAQLRDERELLRQKINQLNELVVTLSGEQLPPTEEAVAADENSTPGAPWEVPPKVILPESKQILGQIQGILSELEQNTAKQAASASAQHTDNLNCCLGKIEVV